MSSIEILIRGEEAEAFAQRLLTIEGISRREVSELHYKGKGERAAAIINLTASVVTLSQIPSMFQKIQTYYECSSSKEKIEIKIRQNNNQLLDFQDFLLSFPTEPLSVDPIDTTFPNDSFPSLQEISKLSIPERHKLLSPFISGMAEDFRSDPELTIFSVLDGEGLQENGN
jgi:hypothetical protein